MGLLLSFQKGTTMAEPTVEKNRVHDEQIDPDANAQRLGERKMSKQERKEIKKWEANWRTIFVGLSILLLAGIIFVGGRGISTAYNKIFKGGEKRTVDNVQIVTDPNLTSQPSDNQLKPEERIASTYNAEPVGQGQVMGVAEEQRVSPETGPRPGAYRSSQYQYNEPYQYNEMNRRSYNYPMYRYNYQQYYDYEPVMPQLCSDYLGNRYACVQPWFTDFGPMNNTPYWDSRGRYYNEPYAPMYQPRYPGAPYG